MTPIRESQNSTGNLVLIDDVTELARAQRTEAWRDVARRVAHEIKNPLTPISLGVQRLQRRFQSQFEGKDAEVFQDCSQIVLDSTESIRKLVDEFIRFARMPQPELKKGNVLPIVEKAVSSFQHQDGSPIEMKSAKAEFEVLFDADQIGRMLGNLISNALNAVQDSGGRVSVEASLVEGSKHLLIAVSDTGEGISDTMRSKIFEPYFSTRRTGTGLGLAIVNQIVSEHRGEIGVAKNIPHGAIFSIKLPLLNNHS